MSQWSNVLKTLVWCTERDDPVIDFWLVFSKMIIIVGKLIRRGLTNYR